MAHPTLQEQTIVIWVTMDVSRTVSARQSPTFAGVRRVTFLDWTARPAAVRSVMIIIIIHKKVDIS